MYGLRNALWPVASISVSSLLVECGFLKNKYVVRLRNLNSASVWTLATGDWRLARLPARASGTRIIQSRTLLRHRPIIISQAMECVLKIVPVMYVRLQHLCDRLAAL